ncbi:MAG: Hsp33 family molecular chaperone HslO [Pseudomonadota bacterium]
MSDDVIHRFTFADAPVRGQWVRLTGTLAEAFRNESLPTPARHLHSEMLAAVALMADSIKFEGAVALQSRGDGPVGTALAECRGRNRLRGMVHWDADAGAPPGAADAGVLGNEPRLKQLLGHGQMAITLIPEAPEARTYQGVVGLADDSLARNLEEYFANSEQLPTRLYMAFAEDSVTGMLLQRLPASGRPTEVGQDLRDEAWRELTMLADTLTGEELGTLGVNDLLTRLFHEHLVTLHPGRELAFSCTCSRERAERMLQALPKDEILELLETRGVVDVTCEVCGARYEYDEVDAHQLYEPETPKMH